MKTICQGGPRNFSKVVEMVIFEEPPSVGRCPLMPRPGLPYPPEFRRRLIELGVTVATQAGSAALGSMRRPCKRRPDQEPVGAGVAGLGDRGGALRLAGAVRAGTRPR